MLVSTRTRMCGALSAVPVALAAGSAEAAFTFSYPDFSSTGGLTLVSAAVQSGDTLSITPPAVNQGGAVYRTGKVNVDGGFESTFTFSITDVVGPGSDGLAFIIQNDSQAALGGIGGAIGYATNLLNPSVPGIANSLAIEFDTWNNQNNWDDFDSHLHISVQSAGTAPNSPAQEASLGAFGGPIDWADGEAHTVRVVYDAEGRLDLYLDAAALPVLSVAVDLSSLLSLDEGSAYVGFTAATGGAGAVERHQLHSWFFQAAIPGPTPAGALLLGLGAMHTTTRRRR